MNLGLRIDVDTYRGTRYGVPNLIRLLNFYKIKATFFFCVGPDNMGRHLWRLRNPMFLRKMMRTRASSLYGWEILLRGTLIPGPIIGTKLNRVIKTAADYGHEIGLHAWDHHAWQTRIDHMPLHDITESLIKGMHLMHRILGQYPSCSAVPAWKCNDKVLCAKTKFNFEYNSDCRGQHIFIPVIDDKPIRQPQIPVTLPTYDEVMGRLGITDQNYNEFILSKLKSDQLNVYTIHAEVEGMAKLSMFELLIQKVLEKGFRICPLGQLLESARPFAQSRMTFREIPGREGWVACSAN